MRNVNIKTTAIELDNIIREDIDKCLDSIKKFLGAGEGEVIGQIEVGRTTEHHKMGDVFRAEINISYNGNNLYASAVKDDLRTALDTVRDEIVRGATKAKDKKRSLIRRGGAKFKSILRGFLK